MGRQQVGLGSMIFVLLAAMACGMRGEEPTAVALVPHMTVAEDLIIYGDGLAADWQDWSWDSTVDFDNDTPVESGMASLAVTYGEGWAGLSLRAPSPIDVSGYSTITFVIHGGATGTRDLQFFTQRGDEGGNSDLFEIDAAAGSWQSVQIPLAALGSPATIARINIQDRSGTPQPTFYIDNLRLVAASGVATPTPSPDPGTGGNGTISIAASDAAQPVDPRILGTILPTWLGADRLADATFRARTIAAGLTVIRMPGGSWSNHYGWLSCERRVDQPNALPCGDGWRSWAARPTDFIDFLQATGTQGRWVVSNNGTPEEAAAAVAFFNALPADTTVIGVDRNGFDWQSAGHWAQLRVDNGNPDPLGMQLWAVGNEIYGGTPSSGGAQCAAWGWEAVWSCDGTEYVHGDGVNEGYIAFRTAMRAIDPSIQVGAVGVTPSNDYSNWGNKVVAAAGASMDFYDIHQYGFFETPANDAALLAAPQGAWRTIMGDVRSTFASEASGRAIPVGVTEYNLFSVQDQDGGQQLTRAVNALYLADTIGRMIEEGIVMANQWDLANGRAGNGTEYGLMHEDNGFYRAPQYYIFPLWSRFGTELLPTTSSFDAATELSLYSGRIDANTYTLLAINKSGQTQRGALTIQQMGTPLVINGGTADQLRAAALSDQTVTFNGVGEPADDLSDAPPSPLTMATPLTTLNYDFAPYSVTLLRLTVNDSEPELTPTPTPASTSTPTITPTRVPTDPAEPQAIYLPLVSRANGR